MDEIKNDLAADTFVSRWPNWLRWLLFIPASIVVPIIFLTIYSLMQSWFLDLGENAFYFNLLRGVVYGAGIVLVGATVAPKGQRIVALIFLIVLAMLSGVSMMLEISDFQLNSFLENLIIVGAAGYSTYYVFNETSNSPSV